MPVSPARAAAFDILLRVERDSSYASELLHSQAYESLSPQDHALATELVMGVLRWRSWLDDAIAPASSQKLSRLDIEVVIALRLAVYQLQFLDRIPQRAALHESVELVKRARKRSAASFANAVLRRVAGSLQGGRKISDETPSSPDAVASMFAHPLWIVERWVSEYGLSTTCAICRHNQSIPYTALRLRDSASEAALTREGVTLAPGTLLSGTRRVVTGGITATASYHEGRVVIQDEASQLVAALVGRSSPTAMSRILDCCAAPGGKTLAMAERNPGASITAVELHSHRARLLQKLIHKANPRAKIKVVAADANQLPVGVLFERVLVDAPCTGTGTLARNPEIKWHLAPRDIQDLHDRQNAILNSALAQVAPGGRLIYSTCSLEKEENEDIVQHALARNSRFRLIDCAGELTRLRETGDLVWAGEAALTRGPYLRTIPGIHPCDGFFAAILEKNP
jgi:16S rRNA (cytosine967-C5)-methyltransferase